ncbi:MAG: PLP-dependent transferase, partial [Hydrogenoanaerobacterium sp.]
MNIETLCLHAGYTPNNGETQVLPIYQSTTFKYASTDDVSALFDMKSDGHMYSRISNPTVDAVEKKIA